MNITVDESTIDAAADLLSLLAVCAFTAGRIAEGDDDATDLADHMARCLRWAQSLADQTHRDMSMLRHIQLECAA